jgi:GxxExxY protein
MEGFEEETRLDPALNEIKDAIIGARIAVHGELGPAYSEDIFKEALDMEMTARNIAFSRQHRFQVSYRGRVIGTGRLDYLVEGQVVLELKTVDQFAPVHRAQVIAYLKATGCRLGILVNFRSKLLKKGIKRVAN